MRTFAIAAVLSITAASAADLVNPDIPTWRGSSNSTYVQWDSFTTGFGTNYSDMGGFVLNSNSFTASVAGSGNIYNAGNTSDFTLASLEEFTTFDGFTAVVNIAWAGTPLNTNGMVASYGGQTRLGNVELRNSEPGMFGSTNDTYAITFDFENVSGSGEFKFDFGNFGPHGSLDAISVDLNQVPTPGALALLGIAGISARRRRR